jgi:CHAD domain-containing protein
MTTLTPQPSAELESWLRDLIASFDGLGIAVRRDEPDSVHQARTATRRLRVVLGLVPGHAAERARKELKHYGRVLGAARDLEVRAELAEELLEGLGDRDRDRDRDSGDDAGAARERLVEAVRAEYRSAHAGIVEYIDSPAYGRLLALLEDVTEDAESLDELAVQHEIRKHARALRYLAEALGDSETARIGAALQDAFGDRRDFTLLARSLDGEEDRSLARVRDAARKRAGEARQD